MKTKAYIVYLNNLFYCHLQDSDAYGDRPEPYRMHERELWTLYQIMYSGKHKLVVTDAQKHVACEIGSQSELRKWIEEVYPDFVGQLDQPHPTRYPHPNDWLIR